MLDKNSLPNIDRVALQNPPLSDFIPIAGHYDFNSLLSKNGDLIQIIEVVGFEDKTLDKQEEIELRSVVREALRNCIPDYSFAVYLHTIRSRKDLMPKGHLPFGFAKDLNDKWRRKNNWDKQLTNTLYITIVKQGTTHNLFDIKRLFESLLYPLYKSNNLSYLEKSNSQLTGVVDNMVLLLKRFGARRLTLTKTNKGYLSEQLFFYHHLIHLNQRRTPLPVKDLSEYLANVKTNFYFNSVEVIGQSERQYGAIFAIKDQVQIPDDLLDTLLQSGTQFIISQAICFVPYQEVNFQYREMNDYYQINKADALAALSGIKEMAESHSTKPADFCKQQTTILIHSDDPRFFESKTLNAVRTFQEIGLVAIREDFNLPRAFWAQLPGNFKYLSRLSYLSNNYTGIYTNIHSKTSGSYRGSKWGLPISLLRKHDGSPYYFNFHNRNGNGNTIIVGPKNCGKTTFMRFFLTQATRLNPRIIYIDVEGKSQVYTESIGGKYHYISKNEDAPFKVNPFDFDNFANNEVYFKDWLIRAIYSKGESSQTVQELFLAIAKKLLEESVENRLELLKKIIADSNDSNIISGFNEFLGSEIFNRLYTTNKDELKFFDSENVIGINISSLEENMDIFDSYLGILLHKIGKCLDGKPTIIGMNRAFMIYDIHSYSHQFGDWLSRVNKANAIALLSTEKPSDKSDFKDFYQHMPNYGMQIFLSDKFADKYFKKSFDLTDSELHTIKSYSKDRRMLLLKQDGQSLLLSLPLDDLKDELNILVS